MRALKFAAIASFSLLLVMVLLVGYLFLTSEVQIIGIESVGVSAAEASEQFYQHQNAIKENTFIGTVFQTPVEWKQPSDYAYLTYTLRIQNNCLVPIDMIEVQIIPQSNDILQVGDLQVHSLGTKSTGDLSVQILTSKDAHPVREMIVTYYVWGVSFSLKTTYGT